MCRGREAVGGEKRPIAPQKLVRGGQLLHTATDCDRYSSIPLYFRKDGVSNANLRYRESSRRASTRGLGGQNMG